MAYRLEASGARRISSTAADDDGLVSPAVIPSDSSTVFEAYFSTGDIDMTSDAPVSIPLGPAIGSEFHYCVIRVKGGRVDATITTGLGVATLPVEPRLEWRSDNYPATALSLQRPLGVEVVVSVYLGRRAD